MLGEAHSYLWNILLWTYSKNKERKRSNGDYLFNYDVTHLDVGNLVTVL